VWTTPSVANDGLLVRFPGSELVDSSFVTPARRLITAMATMTTSTATVTTVATAALVLCAPTDDVLTRRALAFVGDFGVFGDFGVDAGENPPLHLPLFGVPLPVNPAYPEVVAVRAIVAVHPHTSIVIGFGDKATAACHARAASANATGSTGVDSGL
jgi:hypothetical protein